jgi:Rieske Fe-S protein
MLLSDLILRRSNPLAELFDPSRLRPKASAFEWVKENVDYPLHFIGDRLKPADALADVPRGEGRIVKMKGTRLAVYRDEAGAVTAMSPVCTHMACDVRWNQAEKSWDCPCHGGRFDAVGNVIDGPPLQPLARRELPKRRSATPLFIAAVGAVVIGVALRRLL